MNPSPAARTRHLIYLVDDEDLLLDMAEVALMGSDRYALKRFHDAETALQAFAEETDKPDLLLTDYAMGAMNGLELSERCKGAHPPLKIVMVSGTAGPQIIENASIKVDCFLAKPYKPTELAETVRALLND